MFAFQRGSKQISDKYPVAGGEVIQIDFSANGKMFFVLTRQNVNIFTTVRGKYYLFQVIDLREVFAEYEILSAVKPFSLDQYILHVKAEGKVNLVAIGKGDPFVERPSSLRANNYVIIDVVRRVVISLKSDIIGASEDGTFLFYKEIINDKSLLTIVNIYNETIYRESGYPSVRFHLMSGKGGFRYFVYKIKSELIEIEEFTFSSDFLLKSRRKMTELKLGHNYSYDLQPSTNLRKASLFVDKCVEIKGFFKGARDLFGSYIGYKDRINERCVFSETIFDPTIPSFRVVREIQFEHNNLDEIVFITSNPDIPRQVIYVYYFEGNYYLNLLNVGPKGNIETSKELAIFEEDPLVAISPTGQYAIVADEDEIIYLDFKNKSSI